MQANQIPQNQLSNLQPMKVNKSINEDHDRNYRAELIKQYISRSKGILHLGAHLGQEAEKYDELEKRVLWVEALPEIYKRLDERLRGFKNQNALLALLGNTDHTDITFYISNNFEGASSSIFEFGEYANGDKSLWPQQNLHMTGEIHLQCITLDTLFSANQIDVQDYDFWVIDLQGSEKLALEGAAESLKCSRSLLVEVSTVEVYKSGVLWPELKDFLEKNGFSPLWEPFDQHCDVLFSKINTKEIINTFHSQHYLEHNSKRLMHLASLNLDLSNKTVLEVGSGIGDHTRFYLEHGCKITATEIRPENIQIIEERYHDHSDLLEILCLDLDNPTNLRKRFDVIHCYGILYHLQRPGKALEFLSKHCSGLLLLETCVSFGEEEEINTLPEPSHNYSQSFFGCGCRPTREWVWKRLGEVMPYVYATKTQPLHEEFPLDWTKDFNPAARLSRAVFVASRYSLDDNQELLSYLPLHQSPMRTP